MSESDVTNLCEELPETNHDFLDAGVDLHALDEISFEGKQTVLERLGPAHFRSKGFSFMGFLQTVYDHVAQHTSQPAAEQATPDPTPSKESDTQTEAVKEVDQDPGDPSQSEGLV